MTQLKENNSSADNAWFSDAEAVALLLNLYGLECREIRPLNSYIDRNYYIKTDSGAEYVLKIAHEEENVSLLEAQTQAMIHTGRTVCCQDVIKTIQGETLTRITSRKGSSHWLWLLSYLPGRFLGELKHHSPALLEDLGDFLGRIDLALSDFHHPALHQYLRWDLKTAGDLYDSSRYIEDPQRRRVTRYFLRLFETYAIPAFPRLRSGVIYNDANDYNVLTDASGERISGVIDFGDMVHSYILCDPAIAIAYAIHGKEDPLETAASVLKGYQRRFPLTEDELDVLFYFICARLCMTLCLSASQLKLDPENEYLKISVEPAWKALEQMMEVNPDRAAGIFRQACGMTGVKDGGLEKGEILSLRSRHLGKSLSVSYDRPLKIVRGAMQYLYDESGRTYLDTVNNVCHIGHCHPEAVRAGQRQMALLNTNTRYLHDHIVEYARELTSLLPEPLKVCFFVCSGSEANELALRLARTYTGRRDIVVLDHAYHGNTGSLVEISPYKFNGRGGKGAPDFVHIMTMPDDYRGEYKRNDPEAGIKYAAETPLLLEKLAARGAAPAAFIAESLAGVGGQVIWPKGYLQAVYPSIRKNGALCIADEVQVGFGRVGTHFWAFETQEVVPDIVTMGKPIGNGHPMAAVITTQEIADAFNNGMEYFNTFGGNPVSCAIGRAVLRVIREDGLQEHALKTGDYFLRGLRSLMDRFPLIGDVRGLGLFLGAELVKSRETLEPAHEAAALIVERMKEEGVLASVDGPLHNVLKIKPPMPFTMRNADQYLHVLEKILSGLSSQ